MATARKQKQLNECILWAANKNETEKLKFYLREGATVDKTDSYKRTSLIKSVQHGNIDMFESLIANGASVNKSDVEEETALLHSAYNGCFDIMCRLIELGADVNHKNKNNETSVYIASKYGHYDCVRRLVMVGADYTVRSKFEKTAMDVAVESMYKAKRQNREEKYLQLENIIELLSDSNKIEALRKQEKMFTLTPEEFRLCLERSEYRSSDVNVRVIGLNDHSTQAVTRALVGQLDPEIVNGMSVYHGMCDLNIENGEWIKHNKISDRELIYRKMGEVVRHFVNTYDFEKENQNEKQIKKNKFSHLFRSNTAYEPDLNVDRFSFETAPNGLQRNDSSALLLTRSKTATSLYSLKSERSAISLTGMNFSIAGSSSAEFNSNGTETQSQNFETQPRLAQFVQGAKSRYSKAVQSMKKKVDSLFQPRTENTTADTNLVKDRKQVYGTFECVKRAMQTDNKMLASVSVSSLSAKYDFIIAHRLLFETSAIHIFVIDEDVDLEARCAILSDEDFNFTNREYMEYLVHCITRRNKENVEDHSKIIFVKLNTGENEKSSCSENGLFGYLKDILHGTHIGSHAIIDSNLQFTYEDLYSDKMNLLTQHIVCQVTDMVNVRQPKPATWLSLQESLIMAYENSSGVLDMVELVEICLRITNIVTSHRKRDVEEFLQHETCTGNVLCMRLNDGVEYFCLDITILYQLLSFLRQVKILQAPAKHDAMHLSDRLKTLSKVDKSLAKCYVSVSDPFVSLACSLYFISTSAFRSPHNTSDNDFFVPTSSSGLATESVVSQFQRFEYSSCFAFKFQHAVEIPSVFKSITCALYELFPLKQIRGKDLVFKNFVTFSIDSFHCLCITISNNIMNCRVTRFVTANSNGWFSKSDICSGIFSLLKHIVSQILDSLSYKRKEVPTEYIVVLDTCSQSSPCMVEGTELAVKDTYTCSKHNILVYPKEILSIWNSPQAFPMVIVEDCSHICRGLTSQTLTETATDSDFARIIRRISVHARNRILSSLRTELHLPTIDSLDTNLDRQLLVTLIQWRNSPRQPKMAEVQKLLVNNGETKHVLCKKYRQPTTKTHSLGTNSKEKNFTLASPLLLNQLAVRLYTRSLFLALELGIDVVEYNQLVRLQRNHPVKVTRAVLSLFEQKPLAEVIATFLELGMEEETVYEMERLMNSHLN